MSTTSHPDHFGPLRATFASSASTVFERVEAESRVHDGVEVACPRAWSHEASAVAARVFAGRGSEVDVPRVLAKVVGAIAGWAREDGCFSSDDEATGFEADLAHLLVHQMAMLDTPLMAALASSAPPHPSAALVPVADDLEALLAWNVEQTALVVGGARVAADLSRIRGSDEPLSGGGTGSGPVTFMRGPHAWGGSLLPPPWIDEPDRQVTLDIDHPDIADFLDIQRSDRARAAALERAGLGDDMPPLPRQAVRLDDAFMEAVAHRRPWEFTSRLDGRVLAMRPAPDVFSEIVGAQLAMGTPTVLFTSRMESWSTAPVGEPPTASTCGALVQPGEVAAPFAWVHAARFVVGGHLDVDRLAHAVHVLVTALDVVLDRFALPSKPMAFATRRARPIVVGVAGLGELFAGYDVRPASPPGMALARGVLALVTGHAYLRSAALAAAGSPRPNWHEDEKIHLGVIRRHRAVVAETPAAHCPDPDVTSAAVELWRQVEEQSARHGLRNAHVTGLPRSSAAYALLGVSRDDAAEEEMASLAFQAAVQPLVSGGVDAEVRLPAGTDVASVASLLADAWRLGLKRVGFAPAVDAPVDEPPSASAAAAAPPGPRRRRMPRERKSVTHKFSIAGHEGYITAGTYEDGTLGEIFLTDFGKEGSTMRGMMNSFATAISIALQYGVPLEMLVRKFALMRFEPEGPTENPEIPVARSMPDYIMRWLALKFLDEKARAGLDLPDLGATDFEA